jgi:flagellar basal body-associated protein FliL
MLILITILGGLLLTGIFGYGFFLVAKEFWEEEKRKQFMNEKRVEEERKNRNSSAS